jgi:hypothetical protein
VGVAQAANIAATITNTTIKRSHFEAFILFSSFKLWNQTGDK